MASKRISVRIAAQKSREAEMAKKEPDVFKPRKKGGMREQNKFWSASEKEKILEALRIYGTADIAKLKRAVPYRSEDDVKRFVQREKVKMTQVYREIQLPDGRTKVNSMSKLW